MGALVAVATAVAASLPLLNEVRLAEGQAEPVLLAEAQGVTERVTVLQMLRVPATPNVAVSEKEGVGLCDAEAREVSVWLTLVDIDAVVVIVALPVRVLVTQGLPLIELLLEALPVLVPDPQGERLRDSDADTVPHTVARAVPLGVGTSLRESEANAETLPEFVTVVVPLALLLKERVGCPDAETLALRELLGERHAEGDKEGLAEEDGVPRSSVGVLTTVATLLEDAELQILYVGPTELEGDTLVVSATDSEVVGVEEMVGTAEREGVGVAVVTLAGEDVKSTEGLRALDAEGEDVPDVGAVAEFVAHCVSVTVPVLESPLEALAEGKNGDGVGPPLVVASKVPLTVFEADSVKGAEPQLDSDGEKDTVTVRVDVTLSGSVGRDVADAEGVPVNEFVTEVVIVFPELPLEVGEPVLEGDVEPVKVAEGVLLDDTVPVDLGEKVIVAQEVAVCDCDTVSVLLRL